LGDPVRQSDIIEVFERTDGVSFTVVPLTKMVPQSGATIVREEVSTDIASEGTFVTSLSTNQASVFLLNNGLLFATTDGGGPVGAFKAVFEDDIALMLLAATVSLSSLGVSPQRAFIIGDNGEAILGVSDDATLVTQGYVTASAISTRRKELTANHILVSVGVGAAPTSFSYHATYVVGSDSGAKNVVPGKAQYVSAGDFLLTYDEDR
jgi:hypothetical protein